MAVTLGGDNMGTTTILMIEDDALVLDTICDNLELKNFKTIRKRTAIEGLKTLVEYDVDLILLDINMPDLNGVETLKKIKQNDNTKDIPVLMLTGDSQKDVIQECIEAGIADYIVKPIDSGKLVPRIHKALKKPQSND
ncbi:MAG: response regulator [Pseudomonadota bacterium]